MSILLGGRSDGYNGEKDDWNGVSLVFGGN